MSRKIPRDPEPGWKSDPRNRARLRYWDGKRWNWQSVATSPETAAKFEAYEAGSADEPPAIRLEQGVLPRAPASPHFMSHVPSWINPGVSIAFIGMALTLVGAFSTWTNPVLVQRWALDWDADIIKVITILGAIGFLLFMRGLGMWWKFATYGACAITIFLCWTSVDIIRDARIEASVEAGLWATLAGAVVTFIGLLVTELSATDQTPAKLD